MADPKTDDKSKDSKKEDAEKKEETAAPAPPATISQEIALNLTLITRGVETLEPRFNAKVLRTLTTLRKKIFTSEGGAAELAKAIEEGFPKGHETASYLLSFLPSPTVSASGDMEVDAAPTTATTEKPKEKEKKKQPITEILPENEVYLTLLVILYLIDSKKVADAENLAQQITSKIQSHTNGRRSLDALSAKVLFYLMRCYDIQGKGEELRPLLLTLHRTSTLHSLPILSSTTLVLLLQSYLASSLYDQASFLLSKSPAAVENWEGAIGVRGEFCLGRIKAVRLDYSGAWGHLQTAIRRAPPPQTAPGFIQTVYKFSIVVELLMGQIPAKAIFKNVVLAKALRGSYEGVVKAVRSGSVPDLLQVLETYKELFTRDGTLPLLLRLRHTTLKSSLVQITTSYSLISLKSLAIKLALESEEDAEFVVGKAIRDGVISGVIIDREKGWVKVANANHKLSNGESSGGIYETPKPREALSERVGFLVDLRNSSLKAMRYPLENYKKDLEQGVKDRLEMERDLEEGGDGGLDETEGDVEGF